jgi:hypothetical protein
MRQSGDIGFANKMQRLALTHLHPFATMVGSISLEK